MKQPTPVQLRYIEAIEAHWKEHKLGPTNKDLSALTGRATSVTHSMVSTLARNGWIHPLTSLARDLRTTRMKIEVTVGDWPKEATND